jgi:hypothetical protein
MPCRAWVVQLGGGQVETIAFLDHPHIVGWKKPGEILKIEFVAL